MIVLQHGQATESRHGIPREGSHADIATGDGPPFPQREEREPEHVLVALRASGILGQRLARLGG